MTQHFYFYVFTQEKWKHVYKHTDKYVQQNL